MSEFPESEKLQSQSQTYPTLRDFMLFLEEKNYMLAQWGEGDALYPVHESVEDLVCEFLEIDQNALEQERRQMIEKLREMNQ